MSDTRWIEVDDDISAACGHYGKAAALFDRGGFEDETLDGYRAKMALMHSMQSAHTSLEAAFKRILEILGEEAPGGEQSHRDLVKRVARPVTIPGHARPAILPADVARDVDESRRFRHRATHDYDNFEPMLAGPSIEAARRLATDLPAAIAAFRDAIDPPALGDPKKD